MPDSPTYAVTDPAMLRALAHPLRQRIIWEIAARGSQRATDLSEHLGAPVNSVSFHLRTLARGGVVEMDPSAAKDKRDHYWKLAHPEGFAIKAEDATSAGSLFVETELAWMRAVMTARSIDPLAFRASISDSAMLTKEEAADLAREVGDLVVSYADKAILSLAEHPEQEATRRHLHTDFIIGPWRNLPETDAS